ncbi:MAG: RNA polymerase sigma factor [Candidatus Omnitrophica bacterium]|nr:RNA polymerase sigma factor [Candidatus Omnitrophota bacterium]
MERSNEDLMKAYQSGETHAMEQLFQRYKVRILNFCYGLLANRADAEEAAADAFLALVIEKDSFDTSRTFSTWFYTIARNKCISRMRKRNNFVSLWIPSSNDDDGKMWDVPDGNDISREAMAKKEVQVGVRKAIAKLPDEQREAIILRQYHGFSYQQVSQILGCSQEKVKSLIFRAKEQLRAELMSFVKEERS